MDFSKTPLGLCVPGCEVDNNTENFDDGGTLQPGVAFRNCIKSRHQQLPDANIVILEL